MEPESIKKLDVHSLLRRTKVETTEEVLTASSPAPVDLKPRTTAIEVQTLESIDELTNNMVTPRKSNQVATRTQVMESGIKDILEKYNAKYKMNLEYSTLSDALDLAVTADRAKGEITNAIVNNSIIAVVDFTMFSMVILACKQINGLISDLFENDNIGTEEKVVLVDRLFLWINRLQSTKELYSTQDIDHLVKKFERQHMQQESGTRQVMDKLISLLKLDKPKVG